LSFLTFFVHKVVKNVRSCTKNDTNFFLIVQKKPCFTDFYAVNLRRILNLGLENICIMDTFDFELNEKLSEMLKSTFPERGKLTSSLSKLLDLDKVAIYRRLRGDIHFSFAEVVKIMKWANFSMDAFLEQTKPYRSQPYHMYWQDFFNHDHKDEKMANDYIAAIEAASKCAYSEFGVAANSLPLHITSQFPNIYRLYIMKWMYQFGPSGNHVQYKDVKLWDSLLAQHKLYHDTVQKISYTFFITEENALQVLINDIRFFQSIRLISEEEVEILKDDLDKMLKFMEKSAIKGRSECGNELEIYTTGLSFETSYTYLYSESVYVTMIDAFTTGSMSAVDAMSCEHMRLWLRSLKRTSTSISESEKNRILYFEKQREILSTL